MHKAHVNVDEHFFFDLTSGFRKERSRDVGFI